MYIEQAWILKRAQLMPEKVALIDIYSGREWTYRQLEIEIYKWQQVFADYQLAKGDRVALLAENCIDALAVLFACGLSGLLYVPLNWRLNVKELQYIIEDCEPAILLFDDSFQEMSEQLYVANAISLVKMKAHTLVNDFPEIENCVGHEPWMIIYTGGTTGKAKGVVLSFDAVNWNALNTIVSWGLTEDDCTLNYMPLFHTGGINALSMPLLMCGGTVVIGKRFQPEETIRHVNDYRTTISLFVPTMYQSMIETEYFKNALFPTVKVFLSGGAPCPKSIYTCFEEKGLQFKEGYGLTEAGPNNFYIAPNIALKKQGSVGKSMLFNSVKIINAAGEECQQGEVGELLVTGKHMFTGYWNNTEETNRVIIGGWLHTGDLAKMDEDGDFCIVGRRKEMILTGGENVYPQEVEACILQHADVKEVAVVGVKDPHWGEIVTAFVVCERQIDFFEEQLKVYCQQYLGRYKVPKKVYLVEELPKTAVGKIDKKQLTATHME